VIASSIPDTKLLDVTAYDITYEPPGHSYASPSLTLTPTRWLELMTSGKVASTVFYVRKRRDYLPRPPKPCHRIPRPKSPPVVPPRKTPNPSGASGSKHRFVDSQDKPHARPRHIGRVCGRQKMHCRILGLGNGERIFLAPWGDNLTENSPNNTLKADVNPSGRHADKELANSERIETGKSGEIKMKPLILGQGN
jgi:hypothetical protein